MAFLEVVTRSYKRPTMLARCKESLPAHEAGELRHTVLVDLIGHGVGWANGQLARFTPIGKYVWLLDDDDECARPSLLRELKKIAQDEDPEVIMLRMDHGPRGVLPDDYTWGLMPVHGRIGCSAFVTRGDVWLRHRQVWAGAKYYSDYEFIRAVFQDAQHVYWHDVVASRVQRISLGMPE